MKIYSGKLSFKKATKKMLVYGNDQLHAQYVPKSLLKQVGFNGNPPELLFVIKPAERASVSDDPGDPGVKSKRLYLAKKRSWESSPEGHSRD